MQNPRDHFKDVLFGVATGDALGRIPSDLLNQLARKNDIEDLAGRMKERFEGQ